MENKDLTEIRLRVAGALTPRFLQLLSMGLHVSITEDMVIKDLLCDRLGVTPRYLKERIQTIFLNGKAVDDEGGAMVRPGAVLALSAAMPGIAGAIMRKQGRYAPMREKISHKGDDGIENGASVGEVVVKLFNIVARELGPALLERGVVVKGEALRKMIRREADEFKAGCLGATVNGEEVSADELLGLEFPGGMARLRVESA
ncbi:MAG: hypothetical protein GY859_28585 [Desulfobacterales bacterium]|nr:hypothetical protein [Desulfobacterales bacterium]